MSVSHALKYCSDMGQELACKTKLTEELNKGIKPKDRESGDFCTYESYLFQQEGPCKQPIWYAAQAIKTPAQMAEDDAKLAEKKQTTNGEKGKDEKSNGQPGSGGKDALSFQDKQPEQTQKSSGNPGGGLGTSQYGNVCPIRKSENYCGANPNTQGVKDLASRGPVALAAEKKCLGAMVEKYVDTSHGIGMQITIINHIQSGQYEKAAELIKQNTNYDKQRQPLISGLNALEAMSKKQDPKNQTACAYINSNSQEFSGQVANMAAMVAKGSPEIPWTAVMDALDALGQVSAESTKKDLGIFDLEMKGQGLINLAIQAGESPEVAIDKLLKTGNENFCADRSKVDEDSYRKLDKKLSDYAKKKLRELLANKETADSLKIKAYDNLKKVASSVHLAEEGLKNAFVAHEHACYDKNPLKRDFAVLNSAWDFLKTGKASNKEIEMSESHEELCLKAKDFITKFTKERNDRLKENPLLMNLVAVNGRKSKADISCDSIQKAASRTWTDIRSNLISFGGTGLGGKSDKNPINMARNYFGLSDKEFCENSTNYVDALNVHQTNDNNSKIAMINEMTKKGFELALNATQKSCDDGLAKMGTRLAAPSNNDFLDLYLKCDGLEKESEECQFRKAQSVGLCYLQIDEKDSADKKETATMIAMMGMMGLGILGAGSGVVPALAAVGLDIGAVGMNHFMEDRIGHHRAVSESLLTPSMTSVTPEQFVDALNEGSEKGERMYKAQGALDVLFGLADLAALKMAVNAYKEGKVATELLSTIKKDEGAFQRAQQYSHDLTIQQRRERAITDSIKADTKIAEADKVKKIEEAIAKDKLMMKEIAPELEKKLRANIKDSALSRLTKWSKADLDSYFKGLDKMDLDSLDRLNNLELKAIDMAKKQPGFVEKIKGIMARLHERLRDSIKKNPNCVKV